MMDKKKKKDAYNVSASLESASSQGSLGRVSSISRASSDMSVSSSQSTIKSQSDTDSRLPDQTVALQTGYDLRAHLKEIMTFSDDDDDDDYSSSDYSIESVDEGADEELQKLVTTPRTDKHPQSPQPTTSHVKSLVPIHEEEDLDSEEENALMKEIKAEVTNHVRQEMKSELELYKAKKDKLEQGTDEQSKKDDASGLYADLDNLDPKLKAAIIKMRKLDKILTKRVRREKEVKRERIMLERRIRRELEDLHEEGKEEYKEVRHNEQKFLALELPARHNEENNEIANSLTERVPDSGSDTEAPVLVSPFPAPCDHKVTPGIGSCKGPEHAVSSKPEHTPVVTEAWGTMSPSTGVTIPDEFTGEEVFATQLNEEEYPGLNKDRKDGDVHTAGKGARRAGSKQSSVDGSTVDGDNISDTTSQTSGSVGSRKHRKNKRKKDFIKRNKELAADASNAIAMTDEEKKRLDSLLHDVDTIDELPETMGDCLDEDNPFQLAVKPGEGFHPDYDEVRSLTSIDSRLKTLMPPEDYESIASSALSHAPQYKLFTHTGVKHEVDWESRGEKALFQNAEQRDMNERMLAIEHELALIHNPEEMEFDNGVLGEDQLRDLIDQCVTSLSMTSMSRLTLNSDSRTSFADTESVMSHDVNVNNTGTEDSTPRSPRSARQEILDNPPRLAPDVLQKLLSEAYHPLSKQLSTLTEEDSDEDGEKTPIPADVWKLISQERVGEGSSNVYNTGEAHINNGIDPGNQNPYSARNGFMPLSRNSSSSSLASSSTIDTGRESRGEREPLKLPEIDPSGTLVTQGYNNPRPSSQQRSGSGNLSRTPVNFGRNSFSDSKISNGQDSQMEVMSLDGDIMSPHPPAREKREGSGGSKSRTITPAGRMNVT